MAEGFKLDLSYVMEDSDSKKKDTINHGTIETGFDEEESKKRKRTIYPLFLMSFILRICCSLYLFQLLLNQ